MWLNVFNAVSLSCALLLSTTYAQNFTGPIDPRIKTELVLEHPSNGVSTTPDGRLFLVYARVDGSEGPQVVEYNQKAKTQKPYPNAEWNSYKGGDNPATHFLGVNAQRIGPDGDLYVVDKGATGFGKPVDLPYGPKVVKISTKTDQVVRVYHLGDVIREDSLLGGPEHLCLLSSVY